MKAKAKAYCSSANLGSGFDILAVALDAYYDEVWAEAEPSSRVNVEVVEVSGPYSKGVPGEGNTGRVAVKSLLEKAGVTARVELGVWKGVPVGKGLGSSGATAAAAVAAVVQALGLKVRREIAVQAAGEGEKASAGEPHYDNSSASLLGGVAVVYSLNPLKVYSFEPAGKLCFVVAVPQIGVGNRKTEKMRRVLPKIVTFRKHVEANARLAALLLGLQRGDPELIGIGMRDEIVEPVRAPFVPAYERAVRYAYRAGAAGVTISGAGPSTIALCQEDCAAIEEALRRAYEEEGIPVEIKAARPAPLRPWPLVTG